jgi:hypothetical protein
MEILTMYNPVTKSSRNSVYVILDKSGILQHAESNIERKSMIKDSSISSHPMPKIVLISFGGNAPLEQLGRILCPWILEDKQY